MCVTATANNEQLAFFIIITSLQDGIEVPCSCVMGSGELHKHIDCYIETMRSIEIYDIACMLEIFYFLPFVLESVTAC